MFFLGKNGGKMIDNISSSGKYIMAYSTKGYTYTYSNGYSGNPISGVVRLNNATQQLEIYTGETWTTMQSGHGYVSLTPEAEALLDWAKQKREQELTLVAMAKSNPAINSLLEKRNKIDEQIDIIRILSQ